MELPTKHTAAVYTAAVYTPLSPLAAGLPNCLNSNEILHQRISENVP